MLTMSNKRNNVCNALSIHKHLKAHILQSALTPVRSVECGLFA